MFLYPVSTAVRNCSREYITANMLKENHISYGRQSVEFEFEPHTFVGDNRFISAEDLNKYDAQVKGVNTVNNNDVDSDAFRYFHSAHHAGSDGGCSSQFSRL